MWQQRRNVRGDVVLARPDPDHERRPEPRGHQQPRLVLVQQHERVHSAKLGERAARRLLERALVVRGHQVRDHLGVGLRGEAVTLGREPRLELEVVLDDAVVDDHDAPLAVLVGVGVLLGWPAVGGPARVSHAPLAGERLPGQALGQIAELAGRAPALQHASGHDRDARRVVTAVLEAAQAVENYGDGVAPADVPHDAAHGAGLSCPSAAGPAARVFARPSPASSPGARGRAPRRPSARRV